MDRRKDDMHESRNVVKIFCELWYQPVATGPRALPPVWGARRPELVQPAGATVALHEHSEVHAAKWMGSFFLLSLPDRNFQTSMRIHFHFHHRRHHHHQGQTSEFVVTPGR